MTSLLKWIDHDDKAAERIRELFSLYDESESRDELGIGAIRDSISGLLFPGTSSVQTRLRYMLFIPWIYEYLEKKKVGSKLFPSRAREYEVMLIGCLLKDDDLDGLIGKQAQERIKILPSNIYWSGLRSWGIQTAPYSQAQYHKNIDKIYKMISENNRPLQRPADFEDDYDTSSDMFKFRQTWGDLPKAPANFIEKLDKGKKIDFSLKPAEATYIKERISTMHRHSLLAHLVVSEPCALDGVGAPWDHPEFNMFSNGNQNLLNHAKLFSHAMHGAALIYNIMLAQLAKNKDYVEIHRDRFDSWCKDLPWREISNWNLEEFWKVIDHPDHTVTEGAKEFVKQWILFIHNSGKSGLKELKNDKKVNEFVRNRELSIKGESRSRFINSKALTQWSKNSGLNIMVYRWGTVKTMVTDLYDGLGG